MFGRLRESEKRDCRQTVNLARPVGAPRYHSLESLITVQRHCPACSFTVFTRPSAVLLPS